MSIFTGRTFLMNAMWLPRLIIIPFFLVPLYFVLMALYVGAYLSERRKPEWLRPTVWDVFREMLMNKWNDDERPHVHPDYD